jgi:hypothetical protein
VLESGFCSPVIRKTEVPAGGGGSLTSRPHSRALAGDLGGTGGWSPQKDKGAAAPFDCALGDLPRRDPERYRSKLRSVALNDIETVSRRAGLTRGSDRGQPFTTISNPRRDANGSGSNSSARAAAEAIGLRM